MPRRRRRSFPTRRSSDLALAAGFGPDWQGVPLPGKRHTVYRHARAGERHCLHASADRSASMWRRKVHVAPADLGQLRFSWMVPGLIPEADLSDRDAEDAPVRIVLAFDGDHARLVHEAVRQAIAAGDVRQAAAHEALDRDQGVLGVLGLRRGGAERDLEARQEVEAGLGGYVVDLADGGHHTSR